MNILHYATAQVDAEFTVHEATDEQNALDIIATWSDAELGEKMREAIEAGCISFDFDTEYEAD